MASISNPNQLVNSLENLPYDLLFAIFTHIREARSVAAVSGTSKALHRFVSTSAQGWQIFVQSQFPSTYPTIAPSRSGNIDWRRYAEELTITSRNLDRRGFKAHILHPVLSPPSPPPQTLSAIDIRRPSPQTQRWYEAYNDTRQTIGFRPVMDAYAYSYCADNIGEEVLAYAAGQDMFIRKRRTGPGREDPRWWEYRNYFFAAGKDDISVLQLMRDGEASGGTEETALIGRTNGRLDFIQLRTPEETAYRMGCGTSRVEMELDTGGHTVKSASIAMNGTTRLVASVVGNSNVTLHAARPTVANKYTTANTVAPVTKLTMKQPDNLIVTAWSVQLLGNSLVAVGTNGSHPLAIHAVTPTGLSPTPIRTFSAAGCADGTTSTVLAIKALPDIRNSVDVFVAGWFNGSTLYQPLTLQSFPPQANYIQVCMTSAHQMHTHHHL
jgi:hypothetical protein